MVYPVHEDPAYSAPLRCHTTKLVNPNNFYTSLLSRLRFSPQSPKQLLLLVERAGQKYLWIGKRSEGKQTYPGMLDHLAARGLPHGIACGDNIVKECEEEAGIPSSISMEAIPVGAVSYMDIDGYRYKRDVLFCYDLKLPEGFIPENQDGEVESFKLIPVADIANVIKKTEYFKPNCNLVIMDFLFRHGFIRPEQFGYL